MYDVRVNHGSSLCSACRFHGGRVSRLRPILDRLDASLRYRTGHLATDDPEETAERRQERIEHEQILLSVIGAQRLAVMALRDAGTINDVALRQVERDLDLDELRMES